MSSRPFGERLLTHLFEAAAAIAWMCVGLAYIVNEDTEQESPVGRDVAPLDLVWSGFYIAACPAILYGLWGGPLKWRHRVAGLVLLAAGLVMQGFAAATDDLEPRVFVYCLYAAACFLRIVHLARLLRRGR